MPRIEIPPLAPYILSLILSVGVMVYVWTRRNARGALAFTAYSFGQSLWIFAFIFELTAPSIPGKILWDSVQGIAGLVIVIAFPVFVFQYSEYPLKRPRLLFYLSLIAPVAFALAILTNSFHHLVYSNPHIQQTRPFTELVYDFTTIVFIYGTYIYSVSALAVYVLLSRALKSQGLYRSQAGWIVLGILIPITGTIFALVGIQITPQRDATPFAAALGNLIIVWALYRFQTFQVVPIARDRVFEAMVEPVVILDNQNIIVDINYSMLTLLGIKYEDVIGQPAKTIFDTFPIPIKAHTSVSYGRAEAEYMIGGMTVHYELVIWPLYNQNKQMSGRIFISHDITALKELEKELRKLNAQLEDRVRVRTQDLENAYDTALEGWARALELRDKETEGHSRRVTNLTLKIASTMGLDHDELEHIRRGAILHDIGKMGISDEILHKNGGLNENERAEINKHPDMAYSLLKPIKFLEKALDIPYCHHEKWDGSGYPRGLKGHDIPMSARIFAVADVWDAICSDRSYNKSWPRDKAIAYFVEQSEKHFDPRVVNIFLEMVEKGEV